MTAKIAWTIAGSDSGGSAGIQNDGLTFHHLGVQTCSVISAITSQNIDEIRSIFYLNAESIASQIHALAQQMPPNAIKIGMLGNAPAINILNNFLESYTGYIVLDPLLASSSGCNLFEGDLEDYLSELRKLFKFVDVLTPNLSEAEKISGHFIQSHDDMKKAAEIILSLGAKSILIKGGHFQGDKFSQDYWTNGSDHFWLSKERLKKKNCRGTGCALSSAIAASLALEYGIKDSIVIAKMYVNRGIRLSHSGSTFSAQFFHGGWPEEQLDLPYLSPHPIKNSPHQFNSLTHKSIGLYPIVDSLEWLKKLLALGVKTLQLRVKNKLSNALEQDIIESIRLAKEYQAILFINDYWELALKHGAYGVHLGQGDLVHADLNKIREAGLRLGLSTHCYYEVARAHALNPSYIACGPIFFTTSKKMPFLPQGVEKLRRWRRTLNYPLVAIGGINSENLDEILETNVDGIAIMSAITQHKQANEITKKFLKRVNESICKQNDERFIE